MSPTRTFPEPTAHLSPKSKIERLWDAALPGESISHRRVEIFDSAANMSYMPVQYEFTSVENEIPLDPPSGDWILKSFRSFVRGEFGGEHHRPWPGYDPANIQDSIADPTIGDTYLAHCEAELVFGGVLQAIHGERRVSMVEIMYEIFCADLLGNPSNRDNLHFPDFSTLVSGHVQNQLRLQLVFLGFPFKDQNPFRTQTEPGRPDLAETAMLVHLHCLTMALYTVHPFGADWIILTDGRAYAPLFGVREDAATSYVSRVREVRNRLNLQGSISFLDLEAAAFHLDGLHHKGRFAAHREAIEAELTRLVEREEPATEAMETLKRGMAWNYASDTIVRQYGLSYKELWHVLSLHEGEPLPSKTRSAQRHMSELVRTAALAYASFNLAMRWQRTIERLFPQAIRATVHPKAGQLAIPRLGSVFPWNGVPVTTAEEPGPGSLQVMPLYQLLREQPRVRCHRDDQGRACYYSRG